MTAGGIPNGSRTVAARCLAGLVAPSGRGSQSPPMRNLASLRGLSCLFVALVSASSGACAVSNERSSGGEPLDGSTDGGLAFDAAAQETDARHADDGGLALDGASDGASVSGTSVIYATTDTELWSMDPSTKIVTKVGSFDFGSASPENVTDVAVDGSGAVWINSTSHVYLATLPTTGPGPVALALKLTLPGSSKFYALGFAPAGVLESGEGLVAGDSLGDLYYIPASSPTPTLQKLGGFGPCASGDPSPCKSGDVWELSGDVVFYSLDGKPRGLATLRACSKGACQNTNDVVAEVDMVALATKSPVANLRKQILGKGSGYSRLFGVGAWDDKIYGFSFADKTASAQLVSIDSTGAGSSLQTFDSLAAGWTGAGVSTKAKISVIK